MIRLLANLCFLGSFISFAVTTLGLYKMPDPYNLMHAVSVADSVGVGFAILGFFLVSPSWAVRIKLLVVLALFWIVNPATSHLVLKAGFVREEPLAAETRAMKG
ncbi:MAG TPA: monovalent cation/H(+) antiporter subunit G [Firmicutes bacterium]|nr:monovalent cation/H(+) antiporter subunit G [Bacillota bacterium]